MSAGSLFAVGDSINDRGQPATPTSFSFPTHFDGASPLSDNAFNGLFDGSYTPQPDLHLFEDGQGPDNVPVDGASFDDAPFAFDHLVDLDADHTAVAGLDALGPLHDSTHLPDQLAATTSPLQPGLGAPFTGRDEQGIAADV